MLRFFLLINFIFCNLVISKEVVAYAYQNKTIKKPIIVLDAGHGGLDKGAKIKAHRIEEKRLALCTILHAKKYLEQMGYKVKLTREKDYFVPLAKRVDMANSSNAEIFISLHFNSCSNKTARGIEIYFFNSRENKKRALGSKNLAMSVLKDIIKSTKAKSRGVKKGQFFVIKDTKMPAILIEAGFLTNPEEREMIKNDVYLKKISYGVATGIENFIKKYT